MLSQRRFCADFLGTPEPPGSNILPAITSVDAYWRRILHTGHHRTQLTVYLRLLGHAVPAIYGPTVDISWTGADPTQSVEAAERR